jgi:hypothetical protein
MRPLRLTKQTWRVVADWAGDQPPGRQREAVRLLRALMDGSWDDEFDHNPASPEVVAVLVAPHHPAYMRIYEEDGVDYGDVFTIESDPGVQGPDSGEELGVDPEPVAGLDDEGRRPPPEPPELYAEPYESAEDFAKRAEEYRRGI